MTAPRLRILAAGLGVTLAVSACSLGARQTMANDLVGGAYRAIARGTARGTLAVSVTLVKSTQPTIPGPPRIVPTAVTGVPAELDLATSRAAVGTAGPDGTAAIIFDGSRVYQHRAASAVSLGGAATNLLSVGGQPAGGPGGSAGAVAAALAAAAPAKTAGQANRRPWLELDFSQLARKDTNRTAGSLAISPDLIVFLLKGTLTGSVHRVGAETAGGVNATHYKMNVSLDKTEAGLPDAARQLIDKIFRANAVRGRVFKAEAWIGSDGLPRRIVLNVRQQLDQDARANLRVQLDLGDFGAPPTVQDPGLDQIAKVTSLGQLVHAAVA